MVKLEPVFLHTYHNSLLASYQGLWKTFLTMHKNSFMHNTLVKIWMFVKACDIFQRKKFKLLNIQDTYWLFPNGKLVRGNDLYAKRTCWFQISVSCYRWNYQPFVCYTNQNKSRTTCSKSITSQSDMQFGTPKLLIIDRDSAWQFKNRKTDTNHWKEDNKTPEIKSRNVAIVCNHCNLCNEYLCIPSIIRLYHHLTLIFHD